MDFKNQKTKLSLCVLLFVVVACFQSYGQSKNAAENLKRQATEMGKALIGNNYMVFSKYTYPPLLKAMGGEPKMEAALKNAVEGMKSKGMAFKSITFGEPSTIVKRGQELQCTIPQHTEISTSPGRAISTSTLIAVSNDNGANWTFLDTSNKDIATIRKIMPNLSPSITIPAQQPPTRYND